MPEPKARTYPGVYRRHRSSCEHRGDAEAACPCPWAFVAEVRRRGKRIQQTGSGFASKTAARKARESALADLSGIEAPVDRRRTVVGAFATWLDEQLATGVLRPSTGVGYRAHGRNYVEPYFGAGKLADLTAGDFAGFGRWLATEHRHLTPATRRRITATAQSFLRDMWADGALASDVTHSKASSAQRKTRASREAAPRITTWSPEEFRRVVEWAFSAGERLAPAIALAGFLGLRRGELVGLGWVDVDDRRRRVVVRQQLLQLGRELVPSPPKSQAGAGREVYFGPEVAAILDRLRREQERGRAAWGDDYAEHALVLVREDGRPTVPETLTKRFPALVRRYNAAHDLPDRVPVIRWHDLRHYYATTALAAGVPLHVVSKAMGHASPSITANIYSHVVGDAGTRAAEALSAAIGLDLPGDPSQFPSIGAARGGAPTAP